MRHLTAQSCPRCEHPIERSWLRCPECQHRLKDPCRSCNRPVDPRWSVCPYCETPLRRQEKPLALPLRGPRPRTRRLRGAARRPAERVSESEAPPERKQRPTIAVERPRRAKRFLRELRRLERLERGHRAPPPPLDHRLLTHPRN